MPRINPPAGLLRQCSRPAAFLALLAALVLLQPVSAPCQVYRIGEGDLLKITVYDNPDLTSQVRVSGEGQITVPLIGEISVNGLTAEEVGKKLASRFADGYLKNPQVSVFIEEYRSKKVTALGEFNKPGLIELRGDATLMEVISNAGGITTNAGDTLVIQRNAAKDKKADSIITVDLTKLLEGTDAADNIMVMDGDSIYVPKASFVYVTGEVKTPGGYKITKGLTVLRSVTLAGGFTEKANKDRIDIVRKTAAGEQTIEVKGDARVLPDDIVLVHESFF